MDSTKWPWSWEEEAQWKADLEDRDYQFLEELIDDEVEENATSSSDNPVCSEEDEPVEDYADKYSVTT